MRDALLFAALTGGLATFTSGQTPGVVRTAADWQWMIQRSSAAVVAQAVQTRWVADPDDVRKVLEYKGNDLGDVSPSKWVKGRLLVRLRIDRVLHSKRPCLNADSALDVFIKGYLSPTDTNIPFFADGARYVVLLEPGYSGKDLSEAKIFDPHNLGGVPQQFTRSSVFTVFAGTYGMWRLDDRALVIPNEVETAVNTVGAGCVEGSYAILSKDYDTARKALTRAIAENDIATLRLGLYAFSLQMQIYVVAEIVRRKDRTFVPQLTDALDSNLGCMSGGSETTFLQLELSRKLISAIRRFTHLKFPFLKRVGDCFDTESYQQMRRIVDDTRRWWLTQKKVSKK